MLDVLFDAEAAQTEWPASLVEMYGGSFGLRRPSVVANFVTSMDGVAALPDEERSSALISGGSRGDRLVMGLLRAHADAVLIGAGTLRSHPHSRWTPGDALKDAADDFAELRSSLGNGRQAVLAVVTASGRIDLEHPALTQDSLIVTTEAGGRRLAEGSSKAEVIAVGDGDTLDPRAVMAALRSRGLELILTEGGPTLFGHLLSADLIDELFLTVSPLIAGRAAKGERLGLVEDAAFLPALLKKATLRSVRRHESHLLLRYALSVAEPAQ
jgi:riboflavin biosynthesis pyrimidine reductase